MTVPPPAGVSGQELQNEVPHRGGQDTFALVARAVQQLPTKQRSLARAMLASPEVFAFGAIRYVALRHSVTTGTISRFCKALGFSGYAAFQSSLRAAYLHRAGLQSPPPAANDGDGDVLHSQHLVNLHRAYAGAHTIDEAVIALCQARRILLCGESISAELAQLFGRMLRFAGLRSEFVPCSGVDRTIGLSDVGAGDVVVGVGLWMEFSATVTTLRLARERKARVVAIIGSAHGPIAQRADIVVLAPAQGTALSFSVVAITAAMEHIVDRIVRLKRSRGDDAGERLHYRFAEEDVLAPLVSSDRADDAWTETR